MTEAVLSDVVFRRAHGDAEVREARELMFRSFGPSYYEFKALKELQAAANPKDRLPHHYLLACLGSRVVGMMHYYPQQMVVGGASFPVATLAEFCVEPDVTRRLVGLSLLRHAVPFIADGGFPLCWGAARRLMDNYYFRTGFSGIGSYSRVTLEKARHLSKVETATLRPFDAADIPRYDAAHKATYARTWGYIPRERGRWELIGQLDQRQLASRFTAFEVEGRTGYLLWKDDTLHEAAFAGEGLDLPDVLALANRAAGQPVTTSLLPLDHVSMRGASTAHLTVSYRRVPDAGLIGKVLDRARVLALLREIFRPRFVESNFGRMTLDFDGLSIAWTPPGDLRVTAPDDGTKDRWLLTLLFQGIDVIDAAALGDPRWAAVFPRRHFTLSPVDGV